jgi:hypothetical protein
MVIEHGFLPAITAGSRAILFSQSSGAGRMVFVYRKKIVSPVCDKIVDDKKTIDLRLIRRGDTFALIKRPRARDMTAAILEHHPNEPQRTSLKNDSYMNDSAPMLLEVIGGRS